jgi:predicted amidohydrolase YtcJ
MTAPEFTLPVGDPVLLGPVKILLPEYELPCIDDVVREIRHAHEEGRSVAIHCVTRASLLLALASWDEAGARVGDRVEHAAVVTPDAARRMAELGLIAVTQPVFVADRGDQYMRDVDAEDASLLWPFRSLLDSGVSLAASSDAPHGDCDPWRGMVAAASRRTRSGRFLGADERVEPTRALSRYLAPLEDPGGAPRAIVSGAPADLVLLDLPLRSAMEAPSAEHVRMTIIAGKVAWTRC